MSGRDGCVCSAFDTGEAEHTPFCRIKTARDRLLTALASGRIRVIGDGIASMSESQLTGCDHTTVTKFGDRRCGQAPAHHVAGLGWRCDTHAAPPAARVQPPAGRMRHDLAEALARAPRFAPIKPRR